MKALTLWEPWATLVAVGAKRIETRSWPTAFRGPLAIHAAARDPEVLSLAPEIHAALEAHGYQTLSKAGKPLARGVIVATCQLVACERMTPELIAWARGKHGDAELAFGAWEPGRYAWCLDGVSALREPVPAKGKQGLWEWSPIACGTCGLFFSHNPELCPTGAPA